MKHKHNIDYIYKGKVYKSINGVIDIPLRVESLNPIEEIKNVTDKPDYKQLAIDAGIAGDDLKKFMKKNTENKIKQLDSLKEA